MTNKPRKEKKIQTFAPYAQPASIARTLMEIIFKFYEMIDHRMRRYDAREILVAIHFTYNDMVKEKSRRWTGVRRR